MTPKSRHREITNDSGSEDIESDEDFTSSSEVEDSDEVTTNFVRQDQGGGDSHHPQASRKGSLADALQVHVVRSLYQSQHSHVVCAQRGGEHKSSRDRLTSKGHVSPTGSTRDTDVSFVNAIYVLSVGLRCNTGR